MIELAHPILLSRHEARVAELTMARLGRATIVRALDKEFPEVKHTDNGVRTTQRRIRALLASASYR